MSFKINWSNEANKSFNNNIEYLRLDWSEQVVVNFLDRVKEVLRKIEIDPQIFLFHQTPDIYKCVVTSQITLYYEITDKDNINLITFWNVYQNPKKLKL